MLMAEESISHFTLDFCSFCTLGSCFGTNVDVEVEAKPKECPGLVSHSAAIVFFPLSPTPLSLSLFHPIFLN